MSVLPPREKSEEYLARHTDETLSRAIWLVGFGYIFYYVNLRGLTGSAPDVTTEWLCYAIQLPALGALSRSERSAALLKPLAWLLLAYHAVLCALGLLGIEIPAEYLYLPGCIAAVLALYFHFQLLTNVASVAADYDKSRAGQILKVRSVSLVLNSLLSVTQLIGPEVLPGAVETATAVASCLFMVVLGILVYGIAYAMRGGTGPDIY